jgi:hypothetical protein
MEHRLPPDTLELLQRARLDAQRVPFDADALLADVHAQIASGAASPTPGALAKTVSHAPRLGWFARLGAKGSSLIAVGVVVLGGVAARTLVPIASPPTLAVAQHVAPPRPQLSPRVESRAAPSPPPLPVVSPAARPAQPSSTVTLPRHAPPPATRSFVATTAPRTPTVTEAPAPLAPTAAPIAPPSPATPVAPVVAPAAAPVDPFAAEVLLLEAADRAIQEGRAGDALTSLDDLIARNPSGQLVPEAMAAQVRAHCELGNADRAYAVASRLVARMPRSVAARRARASCVGERLSEADR